MTGRIATAIRTLWPLSPVQTMKPFEYVSSGVPVFRNVTVHGVLEPGAAVNDVTDGVAWIPARPSVENVYVSDFEPTLVAVRLDRLGARHVADRDRRRVEVGRVDRRLTVPVYRFWPLRKREPVGQVAVEHEARVGRLVRVDVTGAPVERVVVVTLVGGRHERRLDHHRRPVRMRLVHERAEGRRCAGSTSTCRCRGRSPGRGSRAGATAARMSWPGAMMSGFRMSPPPAVSGPRGRERRRERRVRVVDDRRPS